MSGWMDGLIDEMITWIDGMMAVWMDGRMGGWIVTWINGRLVNGWMDC